MHSSQADKPPFPVRSYARRKDASCDRAHCKSPKCVYARDVEPCRHFSMFFNSISKPLEGIHDELLGYENATCMSSVKKLAVSQLNPSSRIPAKVSLSESTPSRSRSKNAQCCCRFVRMYLSLYSSVTSKLFTGCALFICALSTIPREQQSRPLIANANVNRLETFKSWITLKLRHFEKFNNSSPTPCLTTTPVFYCL